MNSLINYKAYYKKAIRNYKWGYKDKGTRDLRIDYIRGMVMFVLVVVHFEFFSFYNLLTWERIGVISGGEGFVILSGLVVGMVYGKLLIKEGIAASLNKLLNRGLMLYRANVFMIVFIALLSLIPYFDATAIMSWTDNFTKEVYPLYPPANTPIHEFIADALLLKIGPHQFQIIGLYVILLIISPGVLWLMNQRRTMMVLGISWILYFSNWAFPSMPTGAQFEYAFPLLTWQLIYIHGMAAGFHRKKIIELMDTMWSKPILITSGIVFFLFMFFTQNNPNPAMPDYAKISIIPPDLFRDIYANFMQKNKLGILRLVNYTAALIFGYYLLTKYWRFFNGALGWFFIPLGQASLYVFIMHVFVLYIFSNIPFLWEGNVWLNTIGHSAALLILWGMVKTRFLYAIAPR